MLNNYIFSLFNVCWFNPLESTVQQFQEIVRPFNIVNTKGTMDKNDHILQNLFPD